jgi:hypothetical protein
VKLATRTPDRLGQVDGRCIETPLASHGNGHPTGDSIIVRGRFRLT